MTIPEGAHESDFQGKRFAFGTIAANPRVVREWFVSLRFWGARHLIALQHVLIPPTRWFLRHTSWTV